MPGMDSLNIVAVIVATVLNMGIGAAWYGPLFGKTWMQGMGMTEDDASMEPMHLVITAIGHIGLAIAMGALMAAGGVDSVGGAVQVAIWLWLGLVATTMTINQVWDSRPWSVWGIDAGGHLVSMLVAAIVTAML